MSILFDNKKVLSFLPHRDPFLFVDHVNSVEIPGWEFGKGVVAVKDIMGGLVTATYHVREDLDLFRGHFPGKPILPGVIQVEMMAQASSFILTAIHPDPFSDISMDVALTTISSAKFRKPILPGMTLTLKAVCVKYRAPMMACDCQIFHEGQLMSEASILASVKL